MIAETYQCGRDDFNYYEGPTKSPDGRRMLHQVRRTCVLQVSGLKGQPMNSIIKFKVGDTISTRVGRYLWQWTVVNRTNKYVTLHNGQRQFRSYIRTSNNVLLDGARVAMEFTKPRGINSSMFVYAGLNDKAEETAS